MRPSTATQQSRHASLASMLRSSPHSPQSASLPDMETGRLFRDLRTVLCLSLPQAAACLRTRPEVIHALETGRPEHLPNWPETVRVVTTYTRMAHVEPHTALDRLRAQIAAQVVLPEVPGVRDRLVQSGRQLWAGASGRAATAMSRVATAPSSRIFDRANVRNASAVALSRPGEPRRMMAIAVMAVLAGVSVAASSSLLQASVSQLPRPVSGLLLGFSDQVAVLMAPVRDGHRWIEVDDPRSRRSDKLRDRRR
jgi:hypothetical protein